MGGRGRGRAARIAGAAAALAALLPATGCVTGGAGTDGDQGPREKSGSLVAHGPSGPSAASGASARPVPSDPGEALRAAVASLARYGTSRTRTSMSMASGGTRIAVEGAGGFDYRSGEGRLNVRLPEGTSGARPGERRTVTELFVPGALCMRNRGAGVPEGKWVRVETGSLADGNLVTAGATDPVSAAELLRGVREVTYEGRARTAGGAEVRRYRGTLDLAAAARAASPHRRDELEAAVRGFSGEAVPFDAQLDGQGRLRKVRHRFTFAGGTPGGTDGTESGAAGEEGDGGDAGDGGDGRKGVAVASTTWFYAYGAPVEVVMPEPDDIYAGKIAPF